MLNAIKNDTRNRHKDEAVNVKFRFDGWSRLGHDAIQRRAREKLCLSGKLPT
jgi:hypothetical protein